MSVEHWTWKDDERKIDEKSFRFRFCFASRRTTALAAARVLVCPAGRTSQSD